MPAPAVEDEGSRRESGSIAPRRWSYVETCRACIRCRHILFHGHEPLDTDTTPNLEGEYWLMHNGYASPPVVGKTARKLRQEPAPKPLTRLLRSHPLLMGEGWFSAATSS